MDIYNESNWIYTVQKERERIGVDKKELFFQNYTKPYVKYAKEKIESSASVVRLLEKKNLSDNWDEDFIYKLRIRIDDIIRPSIINYFKLETYDEQQCQICNMKLNENTVLDFHRNYPVIKELVQSIVDVEIKNILTMIQRVDKNFVKIVNDFCLADNKIVKISPSLGDYHGDRLVAELCFKNKRKLIYKTRSGFGEKILELILAEICFDEDVFCIPYTKEYNDFIFQEYIQHDDRLIGKEIELFYWKFGIMTAIFVFIGTSDLHGENIIATKKGPIFIDLETIIAPYLNNSAYNNSAILSTYLFWGREPNNVYNGLDISGFSGRYNYDSINFRNIPYNNSGTLVDPYEYSEFVIKGFEFAQNALLRKKSIICNKISTLSFGTQRKVIRNTAFYQQFILTSLMPEYTQSFSKREKMFNLLSDNSKYKEEVVEFEKAALKKLEIPFFELSADDAESLFFENSIENNLKDSFMLRINSINEKFFEYEKNVLLQLLSIKRPMKHIKEITNLSINCDRIEYECEKFLRYALKDGKFTYVTVDNSVSEYIVDRTNDIYIFGGALYVIFLYAKCYNKKVINNDIIYKTLHNNGYNINRASGILGIHANLLLIHIVQMLYGIEKLTDDFSEILDKLSNIVMDVYDFSGVGSSIIACSLILKHRFDIRLFNHFNELVEAYFEQTKDRYENSGLLHGYSGDLLVCLARLIINSSNEESYLSLIENLLDQENKLFSSEIGNWIDTRNSINSPHDMVAISYGAPGILITRILIKIFIVNRKYNWNNKITSIIEKDINLAIKKILSMRREDYYDDTFINGYSGAVLSLYFARQSKCITLSKIISEEMDFYINEGKENLEKTEWRIQGNKGIYYPNFMNGSMGIVFVLMMLSNIQLKEELELWQR